MHIATAGEDEILRYAKQALKNEGEMLLINQINKYPTVPQKVPQLKELK